MYFKKTTAQKERFLSLVLRNFMMEEIRKCSHSF